MLVSTCFFLPPLLWGEEAMEYTCPVSQRP